MRLGIRTVLFALFAAVVLAASGWALFVGRHLTRRAVIDEAQRRIELDLRTAWVQYDHALEGVRASVNAVALLRRSADVLSGHGDREALRAQMEALREESHLDLLAFVDRTGRVVMRTRPQRPAGAAAWRDPVIGSALKGRPAHGTVITPAEVLELEAPQLAEQARVELEPTRLSAPSSRRIETAGMVLEAAEPILDPDGELLGVVYGGLLLSRYNRLPDLMRDTIFAGEQYDGAPLGNVTIFQGDVRIATNVLKEDGTRAIGTRISETVAERVLGEGASFHDRAFVVNDWYLTAYEPIRDPAQRVIGALYVGARESKYLDYQQEVLLSASGMALTGVAVALVLSAAFTGWLARPIRRLRQAAEAMQGGDPSARVEEHTYLKELEGLRQTFNGMAEALARREAQLREANAQLGRSNQELSRVNRNYVELLGFVSHELKSPLQSMVLGVAALSTGRAGPLVPRQAEVLATIKRNVDSLEDMIGNYLNLARIEQDALHARPRAVRLRPEVIDPLLAQLRPQLEATGMSVELRLAAECEVFGDPTLLSMLLRNLLTNAVKYGRRGTAIALSCTDAPGVQHLEVFNQGLGIPAADLGGVFDRFSRTDQPEVRAVKGAGLGLFIARAVVERHGGRIWAESREGEWARFVVELPAVEPAQPREAASAG